MYERLDTTRLSNGIELELGLVTVPDALLSPSVKDLLAHKGPDWQKHISAALAGETGALETRFYVGIVDGRPAANVMTVERFGIGILGHVYTRPEFRRMGICRAVITHQMDHFRA